MLKCIARILRLRKSDKTTRFSVISIQMGRLPQNKRYVFFRIRHSGGARSERFTSATSADNASEVLYARMLPCLGSRTERRGKSGVVRIVPKRSRHDAEYRWRNVKSSYVGDDVSAKRTIAYYFLSDVYASFCILALTILADFAFLHFCTNRLILSEN